MAVSKNNFKANDKPIDPDVKVPDAVKRAAEAATAAMTNAYPKDPNAVPAPVDPNAPQLPPEEQINIVAADPPQKLPGEVTPVVVTPAPTPMPAPDDASWEAKYNSQLGRVRQLSKLVDDQNSRIEALENMLATPMPTTVAAQATVTAPTKLITDKEVEDFGPEMIDIMRRAAREVATPEVESLRSTVSALEAKLNGTNQTLVQNSREKMLTALGEAMPDWGTINHMDEFKAWLALPDPFSGVKRHKLLTDAYEQNKTPQVLAFFKSFVSELAATTPADLSVDPAPVLPKPSKPTLESLAAPGRARTAASVTPPAEKQIIYTSDVNAFYRAKAKGLYAGREAEFEAAERELNQAMREGRVVTNT